MDGTIFVIILELFFECEKLSCNRTKNQQSKCVCERTIKNKKKIKYNTKKAKSKRERRLKIARNIFSISP